MSNTTFSGNPAELATMISQGVADEEQRGMILRTVQTALGTNLIKGLSSLEHSINDVNQLLQRCDSFIDRKLTEALDAETMPLMDVVEISEKLRKHQFAYLELQRKIVQSPNKLFGDDLLSTEEKKLLMVLKSFKTQKEKEAFLQAVQSAMESSNSFDE